MSKIPEVTLVFWVIKILATTLGETGGDVVSMSMNLGYLLGTIIFAGIFLISVAMQVRLNQFNPYVYWFTIVSTTTVGTTLADFVDRSMGIGYTGGSSLLLVCLLVSLTLWYKTLGSVSIATVNNSRTEAFYWVTIMFSQTLGTALGDWTADSVGLGYAGSAIIFGGLLMVVVILFFRTQVSRTLLFWVAFILTRPLGAVVGDFLDKSRDQGGLELSRYLASAVLIVLMIACILIFPQKQENRGRN